MREGGKEGTEEETKTGEKDNVTTTITYESET